jgi:hypothetical protein
MGNITTTDVGANIIEYAYNFKFYLYGLRDKWFGVEESKKDDSLHRILDLENINNMLYFGIAEAREKKDYSKIFATVDALRLKIKDFKAKENL